MKARAPDALRDDVRGKIAQKKKDTKLLIENRRQKKGTRSCVSRMPLQSSVSGGRGRGHYIYGFRASGRRGRGRGRRGLLILTGYRDPGTRPHRGGGGGGGVWRGCVG